VRASAGVRRESGRACVGEIVRTRSKCVTAPTPHETTVRASGYPSQPRSTPLVDRQSTLSDQQTDHPDSARLTDPCKRLRLNTLAITVYNTYHIEWGFTLLECILTCQNRRQGGRGHAWLTGDDSDAYPPSDFFSPTGPFCACVYVSPCYIPLRPPRHPGFRVPPLRGRTLAIASPLRLEERSGLSLSPPCTLHRPSVPSFVL
jgi:hypothetical protein